MMQFPDNLASASHVDYIERPGLILKNYKPISQSTAECAILDQAATQESKRVYLEQVAAIEKMYARKTQRAIKALAKAEHDPSKCLVAS
jgi:hypothetical protein